MKKHLALEHLMSQTWAVDSKILQTMGSIAARDIENLDFKDFKINSLEAKDGKAMTRLMSKREGGVAVIQINGVISRYASNFEDICGGTSTQALSKSLNQALADNTVKAIVLNIDSGGGEASGMHELSEMIFNARKQKPIKAYIGGMGCSAAYWIASAADEIIMDATAQVGSIGTVMTIRRYKERDDIESLEIVSSQSPNKRLDPFTEKGKAEYQSKLDQLSDVFIGRVARNMAVDKQTVINEFGQGGTLIGQSAIDKGMAHRLGSLEGVIAELNQNRSKTRMPKANAAEGENQITFSLPESTTTSTAELISAITEQRPDVIAALQPVQEMALNHAAELVKACNEKGLPVMAASILQDGISFESAKSKIEMAAQLKDKLSAAGLSGSFEALVGAIDNPMELVGMAIHEAKAKADESGDLTRTVVDKPEQQTKALDSKSIYANR